MTVKDKSIIKLTKEQKEIVNSIYDEKIENVVIDAVAGSGKTHTIIETIKEIFKNDPDARVFYTVFNRNMMEDAKKKFRKLDLDVTCMTAHGFAYKQYQKHLGITFSPVPYIDYNIFKENKIKRGSQYLAFKHLLDKWCLSIKSMEDFKLECEWHISQRGDFLFGYADISEFENIYSYLIKNNIYTHGMYLKEFALAMPEMDLYDYVMLDEAQDADKFILQMFKKLKCKKRFLTGDVFQNIYAFRETVNALKEFGNEKNSKTFKLTNSFRFHQEIADMANNILSNNPIFENDKKIKGLAKFKKGVKLNKDNTTVLFRTNSGMLEWACKNAKDDNKTAIELNGIIGGKSSREFVEIYWDFLTLLKIIAQEYRDDSLLSELDIHFYFTKMSPEILKMKKIAKEEGFRTLSSYLLEQSEKKIYINPEIIRYFTFIRNNYNQIINQLKKLQICQEIKVPEVKYTLMTAHRAKGLEWENVIIAEDRWMEYDNSEDFIQEINLAYVAVTRCCQNIMIESQKIDNLVKGYGVINE